MNRTILVVEDEPEMLVVLTRHVLAGGFEPAACARYAEALRTIDHRRGELFAVIADFGLDRGGDGIGVIRYARERAGMVPAMLLTGWVSLPRAAFLEYRELGPGVALQGKPFDSGDIRTFLQRAAAAPSIEPDPLEVAAVIHAVADEADLSAPERELVPLSATGLSRDEIAARLGLSANTVHKRVGRVLAKVAAALDEPIPDTRALRALLLERARRARRK